MRRWLDSSLRLRLTLWYTTFLTAILLGFSAGIYSLYASSIRSRLDSELQAAIELSRITLQHEIVEHHGQQAGEDNVREAFRTTHQRSYPRIAISIWDGSRLVAEKPAVEGLPRLRPDSTSGFRTRPADGIRTPAYRVATDQFIATPAGVTYRITANQSLTAIDTELKSLRNVFLLLVPAALIVAAAGGFVLVRQGLQPVTRMAQTAREITSSNLNRRLTIANPHDELGTLGNAFNSLLERIERAFTQQQNFIADASHELRTPLHIAVTSAQLALRDPKRPESELRDSVQLIETQLNRLARIVNDLFLLAQADAGAYRVQKQPFYLNDVVRESVQAARVLARAKHIEIREDIPDADLTFEGDEGLIRQLLLILLDNAVKYLPDGGGAWVEVSLRDAGGFEISVRDNGPGIDADARPHIFERFFRADKARARKAAVESTGSGAGLGLSIARWITELHHGSLELTVEGPPESAGCNFLIRLPKTSDLSHV